MQQTSSSENLYCKPFPVRTLVVTGLICVLGTVGADAQTRLTTPQTRRLNETTHSERAEAVCSAAQGFEWAYQNLLYPRELFTFRAEGAKDTITSAVFSPDGSRIVIANANFGGENALQSVSVWDAQSKQKLLLLRGHTAVVRAVAYSPDGKWIGTGSLDKTVKVWDAKTGGELFSFPVVEFGIRCIAFSPDSKFIAVGSEFRGGLIAVWDIANHRRTLTLSGHRDTVCSVTFSPDGKWIVSGSYDGIIKFWDAVTGKEGMTINVLGGVSSVAISPDGKSIVAGAGDNSAQVMDAKTGKETVRLLGHGNSVNAVAFSSDSQRIVTGSYDSTAKIWDAQTGRPLLTLKGHTWGIMSAAFSPDGAYVLTGSGDYTAKLWLVGSKKKKPVISP